MRRIPMVLLLLTLVLGTLPAADWPQWRGPKRDGRSADEGVKAALTAKGGPKVAWTFKDTGMGCATPAVVGERIYVMGNRKDTEYVIALDLKGKELWATKLGPVWDFKANAWTAGPNCTPSVDGDHLYALSSHGTLACLETATGKEVWSKDLVKDMAAAVTMAGGGPETYGWGFSWSPLVDGDNLIITPGGKKGLFAALEKKTGKVLWQSADLTDEATYASVVAATIQGIKQYITMTQEGICAVDAGTGKTLWYYKRATEFPDMICTTPLIIGDKVYMTGTKANGELIEITKNGANLVPKRVALVRSFSNFHGGVIQIGAHVYGSHETRDWKCADYTTGKVAWSSQELGAGPICFADGVLILQSQDDNELAVIEPNPTEYKELSRWKIPEVSKMRKSNTRLWTPPIVAAGKLFVRDQNLLFCYDLK